MINLVIILWFILFTSNVLKIGNIKYLKTIIIIECVILILILLSKFI